MMEGASWAVGVDRLEKRCRSQKNGMDDIENQAIVVLPREVLRLGPRANRKKKINVEETVERKRGGGD